MLKHLLAGAAALLATSASAETYAIQAGRLIVDASQPARGPSTVIVDNGRIVRIETFGTYACRTRDNIPGAKLSEHAFGNALDVAAFRLADGREIIYFDEAPGSGRAQVPAVVAGRAVVEDRGDHLITLGCAGSWEIEASDGICTHADSTNAIEPGPSIARAAASPSEW